MWYLVCVVAGVFVGVVMGMREGAAAVKRILQERDDAVAYVATLRARVTAFEQHVGVETAMAIHAGVEAAKAKV